MIIKLDKSLREFEITKIDEIKNFYQNRRNIK